MPTPPIHHPPIRPERRCVKCKRSTGCTGPPQPAMTSQPRQDWMGSLALVKLIEAHNRRQSFTDYWESNQAEG